MKLATLTTLPLLVAGALVPPEHRTEALAETNRVMYQELHKRQFWNAIENAMGSVITKNLPTLIQWGASNISWLLKWTESPTKFTQLQPSIDSRAQKIALRYGPFLLVGANETPQFASKPDVQMDPKSTMFIRTLKGVPWNAAILSAKMSPIFEDGSAADFNQGIYIHHILVADLSKPSAPFALCPKSQKADGLADLAWQYVVEAVGAGLIQTGNDAVAGANVYRPEKGNLKSAFLTGKDDMFGIEGEIVNYNPTNRTIFLNLELEYLDQKPADYIDASTIVISATGCKGPGYKPPQNSKKFVHTSEKFDISQNGYIINARGHLHDGGTAIELLLNDKPVCRSLPTYGLAKDAPSGTTPTILDMSWCHDSVPIKKGDFLVLKTYYDLEKHPLRSASGNEAGHGHSGHGEKKEGEKKDTMEGMEEMGIMTTNFAWEMPDDAKKPITPQQAGNTQPATGSSSGSWLSSLLGGFTAGPVATTSKDAQDTSKADLGSWLSGLFGGSGTASPVPSPSTAAQTNNQKNTSSPNPAYSSCNWFTSIFGCSDAPKSSPSTAAKPADQPAQMSGHSH